MRHKVLILNNFSVLFFCLSSGSLLGIPFLDLSNGFPMNAYFFAGLFWIGLLIGIGLQLFGTAMLKKIKGKRERTYKERKMLIPIAFFLVLFVLIMCFWKKSVTLMSIDLAFLLFSIEIYFYLKRRYSV